jgi:hypothetical protein
MRKLVALGLVAFLAACADTATEPELSDGPHNRSLSLTAKLI